MGKRRYYCTKRSRAHPWNQETFRCTTVHPALCEGSGLGDPLLKQASELDECAAKNKAMDNYATEHLF